MKIYYYIILFLLSLATFLSIFFAFNIIPTETKEYKPVSVEGVTSEVFTNSTQFYPNMRFPDRKITYNISNDCDDKKQQSTVEAFYILSERTSLDFEYVAGQAEIEVLCSKLDQATNERHFIAGEGGPKDIINTGKYYVVLSGRISLYRDEKCAEPKIAIHEILHALGFDHNTNPKSIMYPVTNCEEEIDDYIINEIDRLYAADSLPDLSIVKANAQKNGRYLNFRVEVMNQGLDVAQNSVLSIYVNDVFLKEFDVGNINIGIKKIVEVQNLKIPSNSERIEFEVEHANTKELSNENNVVALDMVE